MKYKNGNIITSDDVTMLGSNSGKTLQEVVENLLSDNSSLKSNVKWIYKYGGVGGSGGGSYSSTSWSAVINVDGFPIDDKETKTVTFDKSGYKKLYIHINNPNKDSFIVSYTYNEGTSKRRIILNLDNLWSWEEDILLNTNSLLSISIIDGNNFEKLYNVRYIVNAYLFTPYFVDNNGYEYNYLLVDDTKRYVIFIDDVKLRGLNYVLKFNSFINKLISYEYTLINSIVKESGSKNITDGDYDEDLFRVQAINGVEGIDEDFASNYIFSSSVIIDGTKTDFSLTVDLLPNSLYLKIQPKDPNVVIYLNNNLLEYNKYLVGNKSFILTAYNGINPDFADIICKCYINNEKYGDDIYLSPSEPVERTFMFGNEGWNTLKFVISKSGVEKQFVYYIYTEFPEDTINWFDEDLNLNLEFNAYYRYGIGTKDLKIDGNLLNYSQYINKNVNQEITRINWNKNFDVKRNLIVNIGLQYNYINNIEGRIIKILGSDDVEDSNAGIDIYLNKLTVNGLNIGGSMFYLERQDNYNLSDNLKYHLITIAFKFLRSIELINNKYEIDVYIDGVLQNSTSEHVYAVSKLNKIILYNKNYSINLLDIAYSDKNITDNDIVRYKWAYQNQIQQNLDNISNKNKLLSLFKEIKLEKSNDLLNGHVYFDNDGYLTDLIESVNIPVLCLEYNHEANGEKSFFEWSDHRYESDSHNSLIITVGLKWAGKNDDSLNPINTSSIMFDSSLSIDVEFTLDIQGSTTRMYKSKNYELGIKAKNDTTGGIAVPIFTPNFDFYNKNSFLPETSFTLKADVVDSSHTNNTCVGKFVNEVTTLFEDAQLISNIYSKHIKNCLQGFPILLFVHSSEDIDKYYYLGIYNFNLGRSSYFNLGYCDLNLLPELESSGSFKIYTAHGTSNKLPLISNFVVAEIDKNESWFDFSLSDSTMLFLIEDADDQFMFDEIIPNTQNSKDSILRFVERASKAGYFTFNKLEKGFHNDIHYNYTSRKGYVPNAGRLYRREWDGSAYLPIYKGDLIVDLSNGTDLLNFIYPHDGDLPPYCNYNSLVEYYTICMTLGLLDSVLKNLNIKSWNNGNTFYLTFYDMDTCLGINNNGDPVSYFAFSDYWESNESENNEEIILSPVSVSRDYSPKGRSDMYDIPSSYIFAVAKYAKTIINTYKLLGSESDINLELLLTPLNLWANWRKNDGVLRNADYFINTFYDGYMEGVNELMFNYNFRAKYFVESSENGYNSDELGRFHGRNVGYVKDWIDSRIHILDAYFNINGLTNIPINDGGNYNDLILNSHNPNYSVVYETYPNNNMSLSDDVYINKSIFGESMSFSGNIELIISAPDYSPLVVIGLKGSLNRYLFENSLKKYKLNISNTGTNKLVFGGSYVWTYLDSINSIANDTVQISSNKLTNLNGNKGNASLWGLNMPALLEVNLTSPQYSGTLTFDASSSDSFPNLDTINISGSQISLIVKNEKLSTINVSNINSNRLSIQGCSTLTNVYINSAKIAECILQPITWIPENGTMTFLNTNITKLLVQADTRKTHLNLNIDNDKSLTILEAEEFTNVTISNCQKLTRIILSGTNLNSILVTNCLNVNFVLLNCNNCTNIVLNKCINLTTLRIQGNNYSNVEKIDISGSKLTNIIYDNDNNDLMLDLSRFVNLNYIDVGENDLVEYIKFSNDFNKPILILKSFKGCNELRRIYGHISIKNTSETFSKLTNFSILGSSSEWKGFNKKIGDVYQLPIKLIGEVSNSDSHAQILEKLGTVTLEDMFDDDSNATNIRFDNSISGNFDSFLYNTSIDLFDVYYIFNVFGLSNVESTTSVTNYSFYGQTEMFSHLEGNSFDRYMFYKCSKIIGFSGSYHSFRTGSTVLFSPSFNSSTGEVIADNGLFSPLINLTRLQRFSSGNTYFSRYLLRRKSGNYDLFKHITYCNLTLERDDIDNITDLSGITDSSTIRDNIDKVGNMTNFFKNIPNIESITNSFNMTILNYSTLQIPNKIVDIHNAFRCTYGIGEFDWGSIFDENKTYSSLTTLAYCFNISDVLGGGYGKVDFELYDEMFNNMPKLANIGYQYFSDNLGGFTNNLSSAITFSISYGFSGAGFNKKLRNNAFPYNIVSGLGNELINFVGFFSELENNNCSIDFPGNMFKNNTNLKNIAGLFQNCKLLSINLTSKGFENCRNLENVSNLFYNTVSSGTDESTGSLTNTTIPYKFFFTGYGTDTIEEYVGTDSLEIKEQDEEYSISGEGPLPLLETLSVIIKNPNKSIIYATLCFYGLHKLRFYLWDGNFDTSTDEFNNSNYIPFKYYKKENTWYERDDNDLKYTSQYDISNIYDGNPNNITSNPGVYCKDMQLVTSASIPTSRKGNSINYFCSPDLFYNFKNNGSLSVQAMFKYCGRGTTGVPGYRVYSDSYTNDFGGRICPYLFDNINYVINLTSFFECFTGLSSYVYDSNTYLIPPTLFENLTKLSLLCKTFAGIYYDHNPNLIAFSRLSSELDIRGLFSMVKYDDLYNISSVFNGLTLSNISGCFCCREVTLSNNTLIAARCTVPTDNGVHSELTNLCLFNDVFSHIKNANTLNSNVTYYTYYKCRGNITENNSNISNIININDNK